MIQDTKNGIPGEMQENGESDASSDRIEINISDPPQRISLSRYPLISSHRAWIQKGIDILQNHAPKLMKGISRQRVYSLLDDYPVDIQCPADMDIFSIRKSLKRWIRHKRGRRIFYISLEILFIPLAMLIGLLPGPNILLYSLLVLLYFHVKAYVSLGKVDVNSLDLHIHPRCE